MRSPARRKDTPLTDLAARGAVVLYDREVSVQYLWLHGTRARCAHRVEIIYTPASFCRHLIVWRTFSYGGVAHHTICRFRDCARTSFADRRRPGALPMVRLLRIIAPQILSRAGASDDVHDELLERLRLVQTRSVVGCRHHRREHVMACMRPLSRLRPQLPSALWSNAIWPCL